MGEIRYKGQVYSGATIGDADYVVYDNTQSGLTSTNVQDALDEIADGGSTGCVELTQAQYDALSDAEQMEDVIYLITDSPDNYLDEVFGDFASVEYTNTASKAYAVGDYLVYDSKFYKVTSAISQGATIVPNTNVVKTTVGEELTDVRIKVHQFTNLAQYSPGSYYLSISGIKEESGIPSNATMIAVNVRGWSGLGSTPNVGINGEDGLYVFFQSGTTISSSSYITVQIAYIV